METVLKLYNIKPKSYLKIMQLIAKQNGYNPKLLSFSDNPKYKLNYNGINFGSSSNKDYIIYLLLEEYEKAIIMRNSYLKRTKSIKGTDLDDKLNKNVLSRVITWDEYNII